MSKKCLETSELMLPDKLARVKLFEGLALDHLVDLASRMEERVVSSGHALVKEGEVSPGLFLILDGQVDLTVRDGLSQPVLLETLESGGMFGELSLVAEEPSFIWATAQTTTRVALLEREDFRSFLEQSPVGALAILEILGQRTLRLEHAIRRGQSRDVHKVDAAKLSLGDRIADGFAALIGSWPFIIVQSITLGVWVLLNAIGWVKPWDPYPFILLNLALSFQAAYAGPIIMMSQNRQGEKDRLAAEVDHKVNVKAETELALLFHRIDDLEERLERHLRGRG